MAVIAPISQFLARELHSESTLPFLNFLLQSRPGQSVADTCQQVHAIAAGVGVDKPPTLPDESEQLKLTLLKLMKDGPGKTPGEKIPGNPSVRLRAWLVL